MPGEDSRQDSLEEVDHVVEAGEAAEADTASLPTMEVRTTTSGLRTEEGARAGRVASAMRGHSPEAETTTPISKAITTAAGILRHSMTTIMLLPGTGASPGSAVTPEAAHRPRVQEVTSRGSSLGAEASEAEAVEEAGASVEASGEASEAVEAEETTKEEVIKEETEGQHVRGAWEAMRLKTASPTR